ncbi:MAG: hypothetical protein WCT49_06175 [Candidatus Paceibacterota bacterium]|jgi:hypothetical protein|nr:hypothetical protein [Candidatus Paceibacterota bacterium]
MNAGSKNPAPKERRIAVKNEDKITWMHVEKLPEIPDIVITMPQSGKWLCAVTNAPPWKIEEYLAQHHAWKDFEEWIFDGICPLARG